MHRSLPTLLQRLRRHKGGWVLLIAALMIKVATGTVCLLDGSPLPGGPPSSGQTLALATDTASASDGEACLLGEGDGCHCACAHAAALPVAAPALEAVISLPIIVSHLPVSPSRLVSPSPLRPPIA
jgi:hypothetical protein